MPDDFVRHFCRNEDGSWTCTAPATLQMPEGRIQVAEGSTFYPGTRFMDFDLVSWLEARIGARAQSCD